MYPWNCCRTCLKAQNLHPIFSVQDHSDKYTNILLEATGLKIEVDDMLPQQICAFCITFINETIKFRKQCSQAQKALIDNKHKIKLENQFAFKCDKEHTAIDIKLKDTDDFRDYDDNITLDNYQLNYDVIIKEDDQNKMANGEEKIEFETTVLDIVEKPMEVIFNSKKNVKKRKKECVKKKEKVERVREEIECEYCHKILTSKLSLRNHYKIHTGFDVVCEHCGKKFITRRLLLMHCRAKHGYEKTDKCSYCDYTASNAEQVKIHERLHTGEKPYVCKDCNAGFHRKSSYLQHVAIHLPEKTVQCDQCPARFKSVTLMRIHKSRHRAPQYTFKCAVCRNTFARRRNVARHLQRIHGLAPTQAHIDRLKIA